MRNVVVIGQSGSGKSTLSRRLAEVLSVRYVELDALFHGPQWQDNPAFIEDVAAATVGTGWVADGNYAAVRDLLWSRADTVVWLDLARTVTVRRAVLRTARRLATRTELYNGNREQWQTVLRASHPIRWTWQTHAAHRAAYERRLADPRWAHLSVVRWQTPAQVAAWLRSV